MGFAETGHDGVYLHAIVKEGHTALSITFTVATLLTLYHYWKGLGFKKGVCIQHPKPWASHPGAPLAESPLLEGSALPSSTPSSLVV